MQLLLYKVNQRMLMLIIDQLMPSLRQHVTLVQFDIGKYVRCNLRRQTDKISALCVERNQLEELFNVTLGLGESTLLGDLIACPLAQLIEE